MMLDTLTSCNMKVVNTFFEHKAAHRHTWYHANTAIKFSKTIDYVAQSKWLANLCQDARVKHDFYSSDHRLLVARMATPGSRADMPKFRKKSKSKRET